MKQRPEEHPENHDRWLVSYADFITLLCAFFILLFASSQTDKFKTKKAAESIRRGFEQGYVTQKIAAVLGGTVDQVGQGNALRRGPGGGKVSDQEFNPPELHQSLEALNQQLMEELKSGKVQISMEARGLVVSMQEAATFAIADDELSPQAYPMLAKIAEVINKLGNPVRLEGHTDSVPIHSARFRSNWELSTARGIAVLEVLTERFHVPRQRVAVGGYADNFPAGSNETETGRARNRRVDIVILNAKGALVQPESSAR